ncbi:MAG: urease accessory protein UreF [Succinivibrio sp.]
MAEAPELPAQGVLGTLMWLSSPALPVGGFSFSQGLEQAVERGVVSDRDSLCSWIRGCVEEGLLRWDLPLMKRLYGAACRGDAAMFASLDALLLSGRGTKELCDEDRAMGAALMRLMKALSLWPDWAAGMRPGYASCFAMCGAQSLPCSGQSCRMLLCAFLMSWAQNQAGVAVKAVPLGQNCGQQALASLIPFLEEAAARAMEIGDGEIGAALPALSILSSLHEVQYSRLFRS